MSADGLPGLLLDRLVVTGWHVTTDARAALTATPPREVMLSRTDGDATLLLRPTPAGSIELVLSNPLDPSLPEGIDGMAGELAAAHERICHSTCDASEEAVRIVADGHVVLILTIDSQTATSVVRRRTDELDHVATETDRLHRRLRETVRTWPDSDPE
jgi:hypothetical protein